MSNVRELLGRLNPQSVRLERVGSGGVPELTSSDIAAALAFVPAGLGREVLIACWWPDGGRLSRERLMGYVVGAVTAELRAQGEALLNARLAVGMAEACAGWNRVVTRLQRAELARTKDALELARARCWPKEVPVMLATLTAAVIEEISQPNHCSLCGGRGKVLAGELVVGCTGCGGRGVVAMSDRGRAGRIGRAQESYRRHWARCYEWLFGLFCDAEAVAARELARVLGREPRQRRLTVG